MLPEFRYRCALLVVAASVFSGVGCQRAVREDRTITFGPDGRAVFQHGRNGVFITDPATGKPKQIYSPVAGDLATSPPAWDAAGKRMIFAVARPVDRANHAPPGDTPADGRRYAGVPVRYTCWLYDPIRADGKPEKLFEATCGHVGYVAAGLAVSWHPDGRRLDHVDRHSPEQHRVLTFDLTTRTSEPAPLPPAEHVALGSAPKTGHRFVVLGGIGGESGLWVQAGASGDWWRVPESTPETAQLEELRQRLPRWSRDGNRLAFVAGPDIRVCDTATRKTETWFRPERPAADPLRRPPHLSAGLHWHPDGTRLGLIDGSRLGLIGPSGWVRELTATPVVWFAGWDAGGERMAYVAAEPIPYLTDLPLPQPPGATSPVPGAIWATLFSPNSAARSAVRFADADGANPKTMVSGLRATFPHWSATEPRLSVWLTVEPPYRLASGGRIGMRPGDPAAVIDATTGKLEWLPVNGTEHAQIGHAELRLGRIDAALDRFREAAAGLPPDGKADWMCFRAIALQKAGREAEAREAWRRFEPPASRAGNAALLQLAGTADPRATWVPQGETIRPRHRFVAEAFVSLEMADEGIEFFRREFAQAGSDADRLSASVTRCQLLLLADRRVEYAEHVIDELLPIAGRALLGVGANREAISGTLAATILPLAVKEFTEPLPERLVRRVCDVLVAWPHGDPDADLACQLVLRTAGRRLNDATLTEQAAARVATHRAKERWELSEPEEVDLACLWRIKTLFVLPELLEEAFADTFGEAPTRATP